jgi:flagellin-like hook-associated protein FlgL
VKLRETVILLILISAPAFPTSLEYLNRILTQADREEDRNIRRLAKGVPLLADDPANGVLYEKLEAHIRALDRLAANDNDMMSYYTVMDGALESILSVIGRIRELALQRLSGINSDLEKEILDSEISHSYRHILFTLRNTEFNGKRVFQDFLDSEEIAGRVEAGTFSLHRIDDLLSFFIRQRSFYGALSSRLDYRIRGRRSEAEGAESAQSRFDIDYGSELGELKRSQLLILINLLLLPTTSSP